MATKTEKKQEEFEKNFTKERKPLLDGTKSKSQNEVSEKDDKPKGKEKNK